MKGNKIVKNVAIVAGTGLVIVAGTIGGFLAGIMANEDMRYKIKQKIKTVKKDVLEKKKLVKERIDEMKPKVRLGE